MKREALDHPKTRALAAELGEPRVLVWGLLEGLFAYTSIYHVEGVFPRRKWGEFCRWAEVPGDPEKILDAMLSVGFLDDAGDQIEVHDWLDHMDRTSRQKLKRRRDEEASREGLMKTSREPHDDPPRGKRLLLPEPEPEPEPEPKETSLRSAKKNGVQAKRRWRRVPEGELCLIGSPRMTYAVGCGLEPGRVPDEWAKFCDHEFAAPKTDVDATWRNWCRTALERGPRLVRQGEPSVEEMVANIEREDRERQERIARGR